MKRKIIPLILITSLLGTPAPAFAVMGGGAEMAKFMLLMMEMFSWMMGGNRSFGSMPYGGYGGMPTGMGSFPGSMGGLNPYSMAGLGALTGTGMPYGNPALMGMPGIGGLGNLPYGNTNNLYGSQYQQGLYNYYNNPYYGYSAQRRPVPRHRPRNETEKRSEQPAQVIVQPVIIQPPSQENRPLIIQQPYQASQPGNMQPPAQAMAAATRPSPQINKPDSLYPDQLDRNQYAPSVIAQPPVRIDIPAQQNQASLDPGTSNNSYPPASYWQNETNPGNNEGWTPEPYRPDIKPKQQSLAGEWLGINGEYLVFEGDRFRMIDKKKLTEGSYVLKNGIMKAQLRDTDKPTYMQYSLQDDYLIFRTEDDQRMMFRRMKN